MASAAAGSVDADAPEPVVEETRDSRSVVLLGRVTKVFADVVKSDKLAKALAETECA